MVPTIWLGKVSEAGESVAGPEVAVPVRPTIWGLLGALSVTVRMPYRLPATLGAKVTLMVQEAPAGRVEGVMGQGLEVVV